MRWVHAFALIAFVISVVLVASSMLADGDRANEPPVINPVKLPDGEQDTPYTYALSATDPDNNASELTWSDDTDMFDIDDNGRIAFTPTNGDVGYNYVNVTVQDPGGSHDTDEFVLFVQNVNDPPTLRYIPNQTAIEDELFTLDISKYVEDPDLLLPPEFRDRITYRDDTTKMDTNVERGISVWTPTNDDVGDHYFKVTVTDTKGRSAQREIRITVVNVNDPPRIGIIGMQRLTQGREYTYGVPVTDDDLDLPEPVEELTFSNDHHELFVIDAVTGVIHFTPTNGQVGVWQVEIVVSDSAGASDSDQVIFTVENENDKPNIDYVPPQHVMEGVLFELQINASDPDMEPRLLDGSPVDPEELLTYRTNSTRVVIDPLTGLMSFTPSNEDALRPGPLVVRVTVVDQSSETATFDLSFTIKNVNSPPEGLSITGIYDGMVVEQGSTLYLGGRASDVDSPPDSLSYTFYEGSVLIGSTQDVVWTPMTVGATTIKLVVEDEWGARSELVYNVMVSPRTTWTE